MIEDLIANLTRRVLERTPEERMLEIVDGILLQHEVAMWSAEEYGHYAKPLMYHTPEHWMGLRFIQYFCRECDGPLITGPLGHGETNSVCLDCDINFGTLPLALSR